MKVVIPMAGLGSRFTSAGYKEHKPLIAVNGKSLIRYSIESLGIDGEYILVCRDLGGNYIPRLRAELDTCNVPYSLVIIEEVTSGAATTALIGVRKIAQEELDDELIVTNCDQYLHWYPQDYLRESRKFDASVLTYTSSNPKNSFADIVNGKVVGLVEKSAVSDVALVGVHYWRKAQYFVDSATESVRNFDKAREAYVSETMNYLIKGGLTVGAIPIDPGRYWSTGTPADLAEFRGMIQEYTTRKNATYFIDLDGTVLKHAHRYSSIDDQPTLCPGVREALDEIDSRGDRIILVSARKESARAMTEATLKNLMVPYDQLILGVAQGCRVVVNDVLTEQSPPRARAVNVVTDRGFSVDTLD